MSLKSRIQSGMAAAIGLAMAAPLATAEVAKNPTYAQDVAPILNVNCVNCHRPGDIAPMSLLSFEEVRPWAKSIAQAVGDGQMPPWHADAGVGHFANSRSLEADEIATIVRWAERGAKPGRLADAPAAPEFPDTGWRLGEPDLVVEFREVSLDANGPDQFYDLVAETGLTEDKWVKAIEVMPSNRKIVHHVIIWQGGNGGGQRGWVGAWAAGMDPMVFPGETGRLLKAGQSLIADMHLHPADTAEKDTTKIGIHFAKNNHVEKELVNLWVQNGSFEIPAGAKNYGARATHVFSQDAYITSFLPHLHYRGKDFTYTARFPDGRREKLLKVSNYDFNWQTTYQLAEPLYVPKGTRIDCVAHWDNSADNPNNPDPTRNVRFGNESYDEMMIGFIDYYVAEGRSPTGPEEALEALGHELSSEHPGEIYIANVHQGNGANILGVLHMPSAGGDGVWHLNMGGSMLKAPVTKVSWDDQAFRGTIDVMSQILDFVGTVNPATNELTGHLVLPEEADGEVTITGRKLD